MFSNKTSHMHLRNQIFNLKRVGRSTASMFLIPKNLKRSKSFSLEFKKRTKKIENTDLPSKTISRCVSTNLHTLYHPPHSTKLPNSGETSLKSENQIEQFCHHSAQVSIKFIKSFNTLH